MISYEQITSSWFINCKIASYLSDWRDIPLRKSCAPPLSEKLHLWIECNWLYCIDPLFSRNRKSVPFLYEERYHAETAIAIDYGKGLLQWVKDFFNLLMNLNFCQKVYLKSYFPRCVCCCRSNSIVNRLLHVHIYSIPLNVIIFNFLQARKSNNYFKS